MPPPYHSFVAFFIFVGFPERSQRDEVTCVDACEVCPALGEKRLALGQDGWCMQL